MVMVMGCDSLKKEKPPTPSSMIYLEALPSRLVYQDSISTIVPGASGVPLPKKEVLKKSAPQPYPHSGIELGIPKVVRSKPPLISIPGQGVNKKPSAIVAIHNERTAGRSSRTLVKDPYIRNQNPEGFSAYGKLQGMKQGTVQAMIKDQFGNIWFCTNGGVSKYDGKYFTQLTEKEGLASNLVFSALEDNEGNLWFGTYQGVSKYDGVNITNYSVAEGLVGHVVRHILQDHNGDIWFGTDGGLSKFDGDTFLNYTTSQGMSSNMVRWLTEDGGGDLWIASDGGGLMKFDGHHFEIYSEKQGLSNSNIYSLAEAKDGSLWIGTYGGGLNKFDGKNFTHYTEKQGIPSNNIWSLEIDSEGVLWIGTWGSGIIRFDENDLRHFDKEQGLPNVNILSILEDSNGNYWFGSEGGGAIRYLGKHFTHIMAEQGLSHNVIWSVHEDKKGSIWLGSDEKLNRIIGKQLYHYGQSQGLGCNTILSITDDNEGNLYLGSYGGGLDKYDGDSITHFTSENGLCSNFVKMVYADRKGNIWIGTFGGGVTVYDGVGFKSYNEQNGLLSNEIRSIVEDNQGNIWFGTYLGLCMFDGCKFYDITSSEGLPNSSIWAVDVDKSGNIWFGTNGAGLGLIYQPELGFSGDSLPWIMDFFTEKDGLSGTNIFAIHFDKKGALYAGTRFGLSVMRPAVFNSVRENKMEAHANGLLFENYRYKDGSLDFEVNGGETIAEMSDGSIWIGANDRLTIFHRNVHARDTTPPKPQLLDIEIFNDPIPWKNLIADKTNNPNDHKAKDTSVHLSNGRVLTDFQFTSISPWYDIPVGLSLAHSNNFIRFQFIGITQNRSKEVTYRYYLEGYDEGFGGMTSASNATYGNLSPGSYTFRFQAVSSEGYQSDEYAYSFTIRSPWWRWWWVELLAGVAALLFILVIYRYRMQSLRHQKVTLQKLVKEKTEEMHLQNQELKSTLRDLKETQSQLIESDKMASLGVLTAGVAHEMNNPLNFILGGYKGLELYFSDSNEKNEEFELLMGSIKAGIDRATLIVKGLNQFSRDSDNYDENCNLHSILDDCILIVKHHLDDRIALVRKFSDNELLVKGNVGKLHQVFLNIISNAAQSIAAEGEIQFKTYRFEDKICLEIADTGEGITEAHLKKITEPFFTTKDPGKGTGLGLSITYTILKAHNATIEFDSELGVGTVVKVVFNTLSTSRY